jgi:hypothetical protein
MHARGKEEIHPLLDQRTCGSQQLGVIALREPYTQNEIFIFAVAQLLQSIS